MPKLTEQEMINGLNRRFEKIEAAPLSKFTGDEDSEGIWLKGSETAAIDGIPIFDSSVINETMGINPKLNELLAANGWYAEPYDSGTLHLFESY
jgi:hypothetical protein